MWIQYPHVIQESVDDLATLEKTHRGNRRLFPRLQVLRLLKSGQARSLSKVAPLVGYSPQHVERWWKSYKEGGLPSLLEEKPWGGRESQLTPEAEASLQEAMKAGRIATLEAARSYLRETCRIEYASIPGVWWILRQRGIRKKTGRRRHRKADAAQQEAFKKTLVSS